MKRKIFMSMMLITLAAALVGGATFAAFSDVETSSGNTFSAGTLTLAMESDISTGLPVSFDFGNVAPGQSGSFSWEIQNTGSIDGYLDLENVVIQDSEGINTEAEPATNYDGDLSRNLDITITLGGTQIYDGKLSELSAIDANVALESGNSTTLDIVWSINEDVGNEIQGDTVNVSFDVELAQTTDQ